MGRTEASTGAVLARPTGGRRRGWLPWLLALIALIVLAALLLALLSGDDDGDRKSGASRSQAATARLTVDDQSILPLPQSGLRPLVGKDTVGSGLVVQKIVGGDGFWVGESPQDRLYVEYGGGAGKTEGGFHPDRVGQRVDFDGPVRAAPADPAQTLNLAAGDAARVKAQGGYVNANSVAPASN